MTPWVDLFSEKPGLLYVVATLLPLASFTLLLVLGAVRWGMRPYAKDNAGVRGVYEALGGAVPGPGPAYVALAAIFLAFICCAIGLVTFIIDATEMHELEHKLHEAHLKHAAPHEHGKGEEQQAHPKAGKDEHGKKDAKKDGKEPKKTEAQILEDDRIRLIELTDRWEGKIEWARIYSSATRDQDRAAILNLGYRIDMLSAVMFAMVTFIATLIHLFSIGYMSDELRTTVEDHEVHTAHGHYERRGRFGRFFMYLSLFCFSMLNLLLADNLFQIFVSWELVGVCSYLLVGFYFERTSASNAANKAFITNRVGDAGFIIGLLIIWTYFGTFNFQEIFAQVRAPRADAHGEIKYAGKSIAQKIFRADPGQKTEYGWRTMNPSPTGSSAVLFPRDQKGHFHGPEETTRVYDQPRPTQYGHIPYWLLVVAGLGIFLGCVGKSAQFPLQVWLPDAMEGPTPVSALIHAATMVAAGVYLVGRAHPFFTPEVLLTISYVGAITLFVAASIAVVMTDIKKVLAYSTVSQLGYMMLGLGIGGWSAGLLHLLTHAFFKALLFLGSGSVIYGCHHQQDMLKMGGLYPKMRITALTMLVGVLAIAGTPLFSGWYSKDEILAAAFGFSMVHKEHFLLFALPLVTAGITTFYMFRMWFLTFTGKPRDHHVHEHAAESPWPMTVPLILLAIMSVCVAWPAPTSSGWAPLDVQQSYLGTQLHHHSQPKTQEYKEITDHHGLPIPVDVDFIAETRMALEYHSIVGYLALGVVFIGLVFASVLYYYRVLDPEDGKDQFPGVHSFLTHKWYFDEIYSVLLVRPSLAMAHWCRNFDTYLIDGFVNLVARVNLRVSFWDGWFDRSIIDGFVNLLADVCYAIGAWLRNVQTGYIRSYVLFLALAAMGLWVLLYAWASTLMGG